MALKKKAEKEKVSFNVEVLKAIQCKNDSIMINLLVNGVYINGAFYKTCVLKKDSSKGKKGDEIGIIQFPQRKGTDKDGKDAWFEICNFFVDDETMEEIEKQIEAKLDD